MTQRVILDLIQQGVWTVFKVAAPPLIMGLSVGIIVSLFQTITSIQEPTLAFVPKIVAVLLSLILFGPYMLNTLNDFMTSVFNSIPSAILP